MRLTRIIMTIVLGIVFAVTGCTKKPNKPDPTTGSLAITSEPSGLNIYLNGAKAGSTTPDTLELTAGTYELQLSASGYVTYRDSVTIEVSKTLPYHAALVLSIPSTPSGANIFLDGDSTGLVTPATIPNLPQGQHTVLLKKTGYVDWTTTQWAQNDIARVIEANLIRLTGSVSVNSTPSGASIWIDGANTLKATPSTISNVPTGMRFVELKRMYYVVWSDSILVSSGPATVVNASLTLLSSSVAVSSDPSGASISVNGTLTSYVTPATVPLPDSGTHTILLNLAGYYPSEHTIRVLPGEIGTVSATLSHAFNLLIAYTIRDSIFIIGSEGGTPKKVASDFRADQYGLLWSPDGQRLTYLSRTGVTVLDRNGQFIANSPATDGGRGIDFSWSHDGRYQIHGYYYNGVYRFDNLTSTFTRLFQSSGGTYQHNPVFSLGDSVVAYIHHTWGYNPYLALMRPDGTQRKIVSRVFGSEYAGHLQLAWINEVEVVFRRYGKGVFTAPVTYASDTAVTIAQVINDTVTYLQISPDRQRFAYRRNMRSLRTGIVGTWTHSQLVQSLFIWGYAWTPDNSALAVRMDDGVHIVTLTGQDYRIIPGQSLGPGTVSVTY